MSTALKLQPSSPSSVATPCRTQVLLAATAIRPNDRVMVIGQGSLDHLLGLAGAGCRSAVAFRSQEHCRGEEETADVVWLTGVATIDIDIATIVDHLAMPRIVAIELTQDCAKARLPTLLGQLRAKGLVDHAVSKAGGRTLVVASRPAWLRRVI